MAEKRFLQRLTENIDAVDMWFGFIPALILYAAFVSWADVIVRAIRGEAARENWRTRIATGALIAIWTITSGARVREMASLRGAAVEMRGLVDDATAQAEVRDQRAAERDRLASQQQMRILSLTKWLVALAGLTLAAAIITLVIAVIR